MMLRLILQFSLCTSLVYAQGVGNLCTNNKTGNKGECKIVDKCETAIEGLKQHPKIFPSICGFEGSKLVVCCEEKQPTVEQVQVRSSLKKECTNRKTWKQGECKVLEECETAVKGLKQRPKIIPTTCEVRGSTIIVCCEQTPKQKPGVISRQKCEEYSKYVYERKPLSFLTIIQIKYECGQKMFSRGVGSGMASRKEFPHMAAIGADGSDGEKNWICGGTLISPNYILTAAHCLNSRDLGQAKYVRIGVTDLLTTSENRQDFNIAERIAHPKYKSSSNYHDIALLKLDREAELNSFSRPACLNTGTYETSKAIASGWGRFQFGEEPSPDLQKLTLDLFDHNYCTREYPVSRTLKSGVREEMQMCAGSKEDDTCQGNSGGPLQIYHVGDNLKCMYDIIGITSCGKGCGVSAGIYIKVLHYIQWIEDIVWPQ